MPSSKQLVFFPSVCPDSFLLWSERDGAVRLRDYRQGREQLMLEAPLTEASAWLDEEDAIAEKMAPFNNIPITSVSFWEQVIRAWNIKSQLVLVEEKETLQAIFKTQCLPFLSEDGVQQLRAVIENWIANCTAVTEKKGSFNEYDDKDPTIFDHAKGAGWQSQLLINSRVGGEPCWIDTGEELTDFSMVSTELTLTLSARSGINPIVPGTQSRIVPDGLGIRRNGFFTVLEVKGPQDEADLLGPVLQAACAATAVIAKGDMLSEIARSKREKRPAYKNAKLPKRSSVGLHVLTSKHKTKGTLEPWSDEVETCCRVLLRAFAQLEYIAFSFVVPEETDQFKRLNVDRLVTR